MKQFLAPISLIAVYGCAAPANPPSLLPRAIETRPDVSPISQTPVALMPISASLAARLAQLVAEAKAGDLDFAKVIKAGGTTVAAGRSATLGSEPWVAAEQVRSALQVARQRSAGALAEIDSLAVAQSELATRQSDAGGLTEILAAQAEVDAIVTRQTARLDALNR
jgi:light-regulated signal transduction histidine kinase (bacteriophytochrome)